MSFIIANEHAERGILAVAAALRPAQPAEDDAFGSRLQALVLTDNGLEMKCFQY